MNLIDKAFLLKKTILFNNLDMDMLLAIADQMQIISFKPDSTIFSVGQPGYSLYIIEEGSVIIHFNDNTPPIHLSNKDCFGEESLLSHKPRTYTAKSATYLRVLTLSKSQFISIIEENTLAAMTLLEIYAKQIKFRRA